LPERVRPAVGQAIPDVPGKSLVAVVVDYPPGGASPAHVHAKSAFIDGYVISGVIESQVTRVPGKFCERAKAFTSRLARDIPFFQPLAREAAGGLSAGHRRRGAHHANPKELIT
jgi:hypothetical protein